MRTGRAGRALTARYGVSRTVVRDAIAVLEQRGLVETWPGSGVFVRDGGSEAVARVLDRMRVAREPMQFVAADVAFHEVLAEAAGNRVLAAFLRSLRPLLLQGMLIGTGLSGAREAAITEHGELLEAVRQGDAERARAMMERHLRRGYDEWMQAGFAELDTPVPESVPAEAGAER